MIRVLILLSLLLILVAGCEDPPTDQPLPDATKQARQANSGLFRQPLTPQRFELASEAIASWRVGNSAQKPALVLFSFNPLLQPLDPQLQQQAIELASSGSAEQLQRHGSINTAQPLILPNQAVSAAIAAGLIGKFYWVFPSKVAPALLELEKFRQQLVKQQILTKNESAALTLQDGVYTGVLRGLPFAALHYSKLGRLAAIEAPLLLHFDTSFYRGLYASESQTPLYTLLRNSVDQLRALQLQPQAISLSYSTLDGDNALDRRFLLSNLATLIEQPQLLDGEMPQEWQLRSELLYASDLYSAAKKQQLAQQMVNIAPQSAAAYYDLFRVLFLDKKLKPALSALQQASQRDPGYAAAYLQLVQMAIGEGQEELALELLNAAEQRFPRNPFVQLQKVQRLIVAGDFERAQQHLDTLPTDWSERYHAEIPELITDLRKQITDGLAAQAKKEQNR